MPVTFEQVLLARRVVMSGVGAAPDKPISAATGFSCLDPFFQLQYHAPRLEPEESDS